MYYDGKTIEGDPPRHGAHAGRARRAAEDYTELRRQDGAGLGYHHAVHGALDRLRVAGGRH